MDKKIQGAWIIHHTDKLQDIRNAANEYESINFAGKCGLLLSSLCASEEQEISSNKMEALARAVNINRKTELPNILNELEKQKLIPRNENVVNILGLTTASTLEYTTTIFYESSPGNDEIAAIDLSEKVSELPLDKQEVKEYIGDTHRLNSEGCENLLIASEHIGFVDVEKLDNSRKLIFNGNLFRRDDIRKINAICSSLSQQKVLKIRELDDILKSQGCITINIAYQVLGEKLFKELQSIGLYDVNTVNNESGSFKFVTKPAAFSRFGNSAVEDAFDLAKTFVTSLTFGMTQSRTDRGRIMIIQRLMQKLIDGEWVGPATAIGQDYKILEMRGVIRVKPSNEYPDRFLMKLLKKDIGELALKVVNSGDISTEAVLSLTSASVTGYVGPERNRTYQRKHQSPQIQTHVGELLDVLRTGS